MNGTPYISTRSCCPGVGDVVRNHAHGGTAALGHRRERFRDDRAVDRLVLERRDHLWKRQIGMLHIGVLQAAHRRGARHDDGAGRPLRAFGDRHALEILGRFVGTAGHEIFADEQRLRSVAGRRRAFIGDHLEIDVFRDRVVERGRRCARGDVELPRAERCHHVRAGSEMDEVGRDALFLEEAHRIRDHDRRIGRR
jgi:hypothetical protein